MNQQPTRPVTSILILCLAAVSAIPTARAIEVSDSAALAAALRGAKPGDEIRLAPGTYRGGISITGVRGTEMNPVKLTAADPQNPPVIEGGASGLHLSGCSHFELSHLHLTSARANGLNIDDGGRAGSAVGIVLRDLRVSAVGPDGNRDGIKLSGLDHFTVEDCRIESWGRGGSGIDLVGCHDGVIRDCTFERTPEDAARATQANGVQMKGGSANITVQRCRFLRVGGRGVNLGGHTGADHFRPANAKAEARELTVEDCYFEDVGAPVAFVGVDRGSVRHNTIVRPGRWALRILRENPNPDLAPSRNGAFTDNIVVFRSDALREAVNIGPGTEPATFSFARNLWFCEDRPDDTRRLIRLPAPETEGSHGPDPKIDPATGRPTAPNLSAGIRPPPAVK